MLEVGDLPPDSALLTILQASTLPIGLSAQSEPFVLLPKSEREWLEAHDVALAAPIRGRDGSIAAVALLGPRRGGGVYDRVDRWFISTLLIGAAAVWDVRQTEADDEDAAFECERCGAVAQTDRSRAAAAPSAYARRSRADSAASSRSSAGSAPAAWASSISRTTRPWDARWR